jgi:hypothetical protein
MLPTDRDTAAADPWIDYLTDPGAPAPPDMPAATAAMDAALEAGWHALEAAWAAHGPRRADR